MENKGLDRPTDYIIFKLILVGYHMVTNSQLHSFVFLLWENECFSLYKD